MNRRTCPDCGGNSFSSYSGPNWECPYCGKDLGNVPNELNVSVEASNTAGRVETPTEHLSEASSLLNNIFRCRMQR